jgi:uncharacterized Tic20 family protein
MEVINETSKKIDTHLLVVMHVSQLLNLITGFVGLIVPLIIWLTKKVDVVGMDEHGKSIINFQLSMLLWAVLSIPARLLLGLGVLTLIFVGILTFVMPIINAVRANDCKPPKYIATERFL